MKKIKKITYLLLVLLLSFTFVNRVKADTAILDVESIKQVANQYNVQFRVINNHEVAATYDDLGDTLEFDIKIKNYSSNKNVRIKSLTILTESEGVDYSATMDSENLELKPGETRTIRVTGVMNDKAFDSEKIIKFQIHYSISDVPCPDCDKPLPVDVNPKTGDNINYSFIILLISIAGIFAILSFYLIRSGKKQNISSLILVLVLSLCLTPIYKVKADTDYVLEIILHQKIEINKIDDVITVEEVTTPYTGDEVEPEFEDLSLTDITAIYYKDPMCATPIQGKPRNAGIYYATATSEGNNWYNPGVLECTRVVTIEKIPSVCPMIENVEATYDGTSHSLIVRDGIVGGDLYYSLDNINWTNEAISVSNAGIYTIYTKVVGDDNHSDTDCGTNTITINKKNITVKATDQSKVYDGTPLEADGTCTLVGDYDNFTVQCTTSGAIENVGEADKVITGVVITEDGVDVTGNYNVIPENGTLTVTPNPIATAGSCINPTYSSYEQNLITGGSLVEYTDNIGTDAGDYSVVATASPNYAFTDGTIVKTITCKVLKRELQITPNEQDIQYGEDISKNITDVVATNIVEGHTLTAIILAKDGDSVTDNGVITPSNAIIKNGDIDVTSNYDIVYNTGKVKIYYNSTFVSGEHCEATSPGTKKSYNSNLTLNSITPSIGYSAKGWKRDDTLVGRPEETITIDNSYTYVSQCIDDIAPTIIDVTVEPEDDDFTITVKAEDLGSGSTKVEWFYRKCGSENYIEIPSTTFEATNEVIEKSTITNTCLDYGSYYVYVKVTDEAGNTRTSAVAKFDLLEPGTEKVNVNSSNVGTSCKSLECTLNELLQYFK